MFRSNYYSSIFTSVSNQTLLHISENYHRLTSLSYPKMKRRNFTKLAGSIMEECKCERRLNNYTYGKKNCEFFL